MIRARADAYNDPNPSGMTELYATSLQNSLHGRDLGQLLSQIAPMQLGVGVGRIVAGSWRDRASQGEWLYCGCEPHH